MYNQKHSCCFTGHRRIRKENIPSINASLESEIEKMVLNGVRHFIVAEQSALTHLPKKRFSNCGKNILI